MITFKYIKPTTQDWERIESAYDSTVFHSEQWANYLRQIGVSPYVVQINDELEVIGYFIGEKIWRGVTMITAPAEGIGTYTQGLAMKRSITQQERIEIYKQLSKWIIDNKIATYIQIDDWQLREDREDWIPNTSWHSAILDNNGLQYSVRPTLYVSLKQSEEDLWKGLHYKSCKYSVNKAHKLGLYVRMVDNVGGVDPFVDIHYDQLYEVCTRKGVKPKISQSKKRMKILCKALFPNRVLMLQVIGKDDEGKEQVMSSGIFCYDKGESIYWTGASYARYQKYCPNELMVWEAMRILREHGAGELNFGGMAHYKLKFGTKYAYVPRIVFSKYKLIDKTKVFIHKLYFVMRKIIGFRPFSH